MPLRLGLVICWTFIFSGTSNAKEDVLADFEGNDFGTWTTEGSAFGKGPLKNPPSIRGYLGAGLVSSFHDSDAAVGSLTSASFKINRSHFSFLIAGGKNIDQVGIELLIDGKRRRVSAGNDSGELIWRSWDVREFQGQTAKIRIYDRATGGWGHILADHVILDDEPKEIKPAGRLEDYRKSAEYYRERHRPQFHFTPEINWMNDPNGLVYHNGEYHLFYQHNPHGNEWGHMSWGHAVSKDLVHWRHLPIALHDEFGVMAFSGSAVSDSNNTSGLGTKDRPPLVAIYTGHGHGKQTQDLASSIDDGRTWTKYPHNPVIDIGEAEFRDPKVFWHAPSKKWVMVVSLAVKKIIQFYGSADLKKWTLLSEFGPAGVSKKPNWECPDLFPLPIIGESGKSRWVLQVSIGGDSVAGGSGGEYFTGVFDGTRFVADSTESQWVDFGRDFYAPVSWENIPEKDGRRIWIGWMNNWETCLNPTSPWHSAMSVPRELSLIRIGDKLRLRQQPIRELEALRGKPETMQNISLVAQAKLFASRGQQFEILLEVELGTAREVGIRVLKSEKGDEQTVIAYDPAKKSLSVDRTRSGNVAFHKAFAGKHSGPLEPEKNGRVKLRILVDHSSVEVFGNQGETVLTELVFPSSKSDQIELYANGGNCRILNCEVFPMRTTWTNRIEKPSK